MLIVSLVLAVIGLAALVFAVITSNELVAWVCIGASALGVLLLIVDALQERRRRDAAPVDATLGATDHGPLHDDAAIEPPAEPHDLSDHTPAYDDADSAVDESISDEH